jgi:hypothetical protein
MLAKKKFIIILLTSLSLLLLIRCRANVGIEGKSDFINKEQSKDDDADYAGNESEKITTIITKSNDELLSNTGDKNDKMDTENKVESGIEIFGRWDLEKVVLKSKAYDGTSKEALGDIDEVDYVGLELEFTDKYLRLGEDEFPNPEYILEYMTVAEYNEGGKYILPDIFSFIQDESINIINREKYKSLSEVPLKLYQAKFKEDYFIPVGTQVVMLNNDTMLVGIWGKIILAHRVKT